MAQKLPTTDAAYTFPNHIQGNEAFMLRTDEGARRMLIVSNRLPFTIAEQDGRLTMKESGGGLVSGLSSYLDSLKTSSGNSKRLRRNSGGSSRGHGTNGDWGQSPLLSPARSANASSAFPIR